MRPGSFPFAHTTIKSPGRLTLIEATSTRRPASIRPPCLFDTTATPFPSYRGGKRSVRSRLAKPGHGPVCRGQTGGRDQGGERRKKTKTKQQQLEVSKMLSTCHKNTRNSRPTSVEFRGPWCVYCRDGQTLYSIRALFSVDFLCDCQCHSSSHKKHDGGFEKEATGETWQRRQRIP